ncbi:chalcone synthase [Brevibacillus sp. SKDU10]|uniref:type III polyketide synthase n=1 Tax=Brevibacillus sp. SKDU10 TaxID=1247872 RepID=UPI0007C92FA8|nr:3-oxoacyl-[acyl-carrier-protein] synthase III C-terminal domain-containing protein [Brevibacillus sp. SKDU10]OAJ72483.1 chalcone synthase [Brevibacillus sp. SKDU10]
MPRIVSIGTANPHYTITKQESKEFSRRFFQEHFSDIERLLQVFESAEIENRSFSTPLEWFEKPHDWAEKNQLYVQQALELSVRAIEQCLERAGVTADAIDHVIMVSSTGIAAPSLDALLFNRLPFRSNLKRTPVWGLGCAGGAAGLARGFAFAKAHPSERVLVCCVELCGLTFVHGDRSKSNLIATSLFADGAAAVLLYGDEQAVSDHVPAILSTHSTIWRDTVDVMGWDVREEGLRVVFSKDIPTLIKDKMKPEMESFLRREGKDYCRVDRIIAHPGGSKVLQAYEQALQVPSDRLRHAKEVLRDHGNMSSCTVLFVLERELREEHQPGEIGLLLALGPGFSCEQVLLEW